MFPTDISTRSKSLMPNLRTAETADDRPLVSTVNDRYHNGRHYNYNYNYSNFELLPFLNIITWLRAIKSHLEKCLPILRLGFAWIFILPFGSHYMNLLLLKKQQKCFVQLNSIHLDVCHRHCCTFFNLCLPPSIISLFQANEMHSNERSIHTRTNQWETVLAKAVIPSSGVQVAPLIVACTLGPVYSRCS